MADEIEATDETPDSDAPDIDGLKSALAKEREARKRFEREAKDNAAAAKKLKAAEDAEKSELEKLKEQLQEQQSRATEAESKALRSEIAAAKGLTAAQAKRLTGSTKEELESDADELLEAFGGGSKAAESQPSKDEGDSEEVEEKPSSRPPKETLRPGASNDDGHDYDQIADEVYKRAHGSI